MKVLLVEDDPAIADLLRTTLTAHRYVLDLATDGEMAWELQQQWEYDIILLDVMLPKLDGVSLCRRLRQAGCQIPILMLTAKADAEAVVTGLDAGADDYVAKPFDPLQVLARLRALQRRATQEVTSPTLSWGALQVDPTALKATYQSQEIPLSPKEYALLELFLRNPQQVLTRSHILDKLWSVAEAPYEATVTNLTKDLRQRLKKAGLQEDPIQTVYGLGYRLKDSPVSSVAEEGAPPAEPISALHQVVERFRASLPARLTSVRAVETALRQGTLTPDSQAAARKTAHQLVGSLGSFGYGQASNIMRAIEHLLTHSEPLMADAAPQLGHLLAQLDQAISVTPSFAPSAPPEAATVKVLVIDSDTPFTTTLEKANPNGPLTLSMTPDLPTALHHLATQPPDVMVLSLGPPAVQSERTAFLADITRDFPQLPVLVLAEHDCIECRTDVAPYGVSHFVVKPIAPQRLLSLIDQMATAAQPKKATVLVVDDDPSVLELVAAFLTPQGMATTGLADPRQFWTVLPTVQPTLLLLDLEMPNYNGIELCQTVRQDVNYRELPILVITAHADSNSLQQAIAAGADDVVTKPFSEKMLLHRMSRLLKRGSKSLVP